MDFNEDFLHYVWQFRSFNQNELKVSDADELKIIHTGYLNKHAGPDFGDAKIKIGDTLWAGNVEIHLKSSDWLKHNHQYNDAYENVVLHVVYDHDIEIKRKDGSILPVLELKDRIKPQLIERYKTLLLNLSTFPCSSQIGQVEPIILDTFLSRVLVERLEEKSTVVFETLERLNGNWDETFYQFIAKNFGFKVNELPFELFAKAIPQQVFARHKNNVFQIEALVFGTAGFLRGKLKDNYPSKLKEEFDFLRQKYKIEPLNASVWKFMRLRPQNFPTLRLAQFAGLIFKASHLFSKILEIKDTVALRKLFEELPINDYWKNHYHFNKEVKAFSNQMGKLSIDNMLINTVAIFLFSYGKYINEQHFINRAVKLLESLAAEKNAVIEQYMKAGLKINNAFVSQGILQLKKRYCNLKKCLQCGIGIKLLKQV